jgi:hypothetical protein
MPPPEATLRPLPSHQTGLPPITRTTFPTCRAHYPGGSSGCACRLPPRSRGNGRRVGIRIVTFEACSGFTHVTARRIAQPPTGDLCHEAPTHAVTCISRSSATGSIDNSRGDSSSTDDSRLRGALPIGDSCAAAKRSQKLRLHVSTRCWAIVSQPVERPPFPWEFPQFSAAGS